MAAPGNFTLTSGRLVDLNFLANTPSQRHRLAKGGYHFTNGGTSMASPVVAGIAALYLEKCPDATHAEIKQALMATLFGDSLTGGLPNHQFGHGKVHGLDALLHSNFNPPLTTSSGDSAFCTGDSLSVSITGSYSNVVWNTGDSTSLITLHQSDTVFARMTNSQGCLGFSDTLDVEQYPYHPVVISGDTQFCAGSETVLRAQGSVTYIWNPGGLSGDSVTISQGGMVYVEALDSNLCPSSDSIRVYELTLPMTQVTGDSMFCLKDSSVLYASGALTYFWSDSSTTDSLRIYVGGTYWVEGTDSLGCSSKDSIKVVAIPCVWEGIDDENSQSTIKLYPNPANNVLTIRLDDPAVEPARIQLLTLRGRVVNETSLEMGEVQKVWDWGQWPSGLYLIRVVQAQQENWFKIRIEQ
ncbi:S8 family peptidase [bacterium SCSIO 12741]|nr:S8 family peptidase [bacterium SCSIO 12741]